MSDHPSPWQDIACRLNSLQDDVSACRESQARVEGRLTDLLGNGQPGRIGRIESEVARLTGTVNRLKGAGAVMAALGTGAAALLHFFR